MSFKLDYKPKHVVTQSDPNKDIFVQKIFVSVNKWFDENKFESKPLHIQLVCGYFAKAFPNSTSIKRLTLMVVSSVWFLMLDDALEDDFDQSQTNRWFKLFNDEKVQADPNCTAIERMWNIFWPQMSEDMTEFQRKLYLKGFYDFAVITVKEINNSPELENMNVDQWFQYRSWSYNDYFYLFNMEYAMNVSIDESDYYSDLIQSLNKSFVNYILIINDLYSFRKELKQNEAKLSYVTIFRRIHDLTIQESIDCLTAELDQLENEILSLVEVARQAKFGFDKKYFDIIGTNLYEHWAFHHLSERYNKD